MKLTGKQFEQVHKAILGGYDLGALQMLVRIELDLDLETIAGGDNLSMRVFNLVRWADQRGSIAELVSAACAANPNNVALQALSRDAQSWFAPQPPPSNPAEPPPAVRPLPATPPAQVFLSYNRQDTAQMEAVRALLLDAGLSVWIDAGLTPGTRSWQAAIETAIRQAQAMLVLLSPAAKASEWVNIEVSVALDLGRPVFPLLVRGEKGDAVPIRLYNTQYVDGRGDLAGALTAQLLPTLRQQLGLATPPPLPPTRSLEETRFVPPTTAAPDTPPAETAKPQSTPAAKQARPRKKAAAPPVEPTKPAKPIEFEWVTIPAGVFWMGSRKEPGFLGRIFGTATVTTPADAQAYDNETPQHQVNLPAYRIGRVPVTVAQFGEFIKATRHKTTADEQGSAFAWNGKEWADVKGANWAHPRGPESDVAQKADHPVTCVSWQDAQAFCRWASEQSGQSIRLPSEAEWEKAARGVDGRIWPWGNEPPTDSRCNFNNKVGDTTPVGRYPSGASPYGCLDMAGNVWEWTSSLFKPYPYKAEDGREDAAASGSRTLRGGSWLTSPLFTCAAPAGSSTPLLARPCRISSGVPWPLTLWSLVFL
jgi:formylglycine-generating enzyme required for sulfatase activity